MTESDFAPPHPVSFRGYRLAAWVLKRWGWTLRFDGFPTPRGVIIVYPHTSNWDFLVLLMMKWATGIQASFWGKHSLFRIPLFGRWLRYLGGIPVERTSAHGVVGQAVRLFEQAKAQDDYLWLALAPEGTRKRIPGWRSGFYRTACQADLPLGLVKLDYASKTIDISAFIRLMGNEAQDFERLAAYFQGVQGKHPEHASPIRLLEPNVPRSQTIVE